MKWERMKGNRLLEGITQKFLGRHEYSPHTLSVNVDRNVIPTSIDTEQKKQQLHSSVKLSTTNSQAQNARYSGDVHSRGTP
jgi:hypothetical protein